MTTLAFDSVGLVAHAKQDFRLIQQLLHDKQNQRLHNFVTCETSVLNAYSRVNLIKDPQERQSLEHELDKFVRKFYSSQAKYSYLRICRFSNMQEIKLLSQHHKLVGITHPVEDATISHICCNIDRGAEMVGHDSKAYSVNQASLTFYWKA